MSQSRDMAAVGQQATADYEEDTVKNLTSGGTFRAKIQTVADMELNTALGRDARESDTFHTRDRKAGSAILIGTRLEAIGSRFEVLRRSDNPATLHMDFGCMKLTEKDL